MISGVGGYYAPDDSASTCAQRGRSRASYPELAKKMSMRGEAVFRLPVPLGEELSRKFDQAFRVFAQPTGPLPHTMLTNFCSGGIMGSQHFIDDR